MMIMGAAAGIAVAITTGSSGLGVVAAVAAGMLMALLVPFYTFFILRRILNVYDAAAMAARHGSLDFILDTVSADHDLNAYLALLKLDATLVLVGAPPGPQPVAAFSLLMPRRNLAGSLIGGIAETQEMLDFCGTHNITSDVEVIPIQQINEAYERMLKSDVKYRFVIDMASIKN
jgi:uncharacterized zinc-type alcohol dehydrogenase-like protein